MERLYWDSLVKRLLDKSLDLPETERPDNWTHRRRSPRNHDNANSEQPGDGDTNSGQRDEFPRSPPRRRRRAPRNDRQQSAGPAGFDQDRDYIAENVGRVLSMTR